MARPTYSELRRIIKSCDGELIQISKSYTIPAGGILSSGWTASGTPLGVAPTTAVVPTRATAGALGQRNKAGGADRRYCVVRSVANTRAESTIPMSMLLVDRLSHQGGLSGNLNTSQTTNLPTAALTRSSSGIGVWAAAEITTAIGTGGGTLTGVYTNSGSVGSRNFVATPFGVTSWSAVQRLIPLLMQAGDVGVESVESMQLSAASGTVGAWGVTLFKTLGMIHHSNMPGLTQTGDPLADMGPIFEVPTDACLQVISIGDGQSATLVEAEFLFFDVTD